MNWYKFHLGDYITQTLHLGDAEDLCYRRLLDLYYLSEKPLPLDIQWLAKRTRLDLDIVESVLVEFFDKREDGYHNKRCDQEIEKYQSQVSVNKELAKRPRSRGAAHGEPLANQSLTNGSPNQEPRTKNQEPEYIDAKASKSEPTFPTCPQKQILSLYAKHLPHLSQPRTWEGNRIAVLKQRWIQASKPSAYSPKGYRTQEEGIEWWDSFFGYIANDTTLAKGFESNDRVWKPDLLWIVTAANFAKIIDGKYAK